MTTFSWVASAALFVSFVNAQSVPAYRYVGCYTDSLGSRTLNGPWSSTDTMTYDECAVFCNGYDYFGLEYGSQCYCGLNIRSSGSKTAEADCSMPCAGDASAICGGPDLLNVVAYDTMHLQPSDPLFIGYLYIGCHTDSVSDRVLTDSQVFDDNLTIEECAEFCDGSAYFGVEFGTQCYCGNSLANPTSSIAEDQCSYICGGDDTERCGGAGTMNLYTFIEI